MEDEEEDVVIVPNPCIVCSTDPRWKVVYICEQCSRSITNSVLESIRLLARY